MNETMSQNPKCARCGTSLATDTVEGLCPACLLALNVATQTESSGEFGPHGTRKVSPAQSPPTPDQLAHLFPQFEILECLGRGGMGVVYKARQKSLDRLVALKILAPEREKDPEFSDRFVREAKTLAQLNHPNIVTVHDFGEADGLFYLVMEFVDGVNLRHLLHERKLSPEEALAVVPPVCDALQFAHDHGVVHRDIKPENLLLDKQGRVKIADFGIAKILGRGAAGIGETREVLGTPQYMAPEQVAQPQRVDHRADIYSLGVVLYEMLTGELPLGPLQPPSRKVQVDVRIDEIVLRALEKEPERRYQTATEFKTMVETMGNTSTSTPRTTASCPRFHSPKRWRDQWPWDPTIISLMILVPTIIAPFLVLAFSAAWGPKAQFLWLIEVPAFLFAGIYGWVGSKVRRLRENPPEVAIETAEALIAKATWQSPGVAALGKNALHLIGIIGTPITVPFEEIDGIREVRWFNGHLLWWKTGLRIERRSTTPILVALPQAVARRWKPVLLGERAPDARWAAEMDEKRRTKETAASSQRAPRLSRAAIVGACWAPLFFFMAILSIWAVRVVVEPGQPPPGPARWQYLLRFTLLPSGLAAPFGATILGWIAVTQIHRSAGRLYGMGLALFDGLLFPLLALDALIFGIIFELFVLVTGWIVPSGGEPKLVLVLLLTVIVSLVVDFLIVFLVWRAVNKKPSDPSHPAAPGTMAQPPPIRPAPTQAGGASELGTVARAVAPHAAILLVLLALATFVVPRFTAVFRDLAVELPFMTRLTFGMAGVMASFWFLIIPLFLVFDGCTCFVLSKLGGRRLCRWWSGSVALVLVLIIAAGAIGLFLPLAGAQNDLTMQSSSTAESVRKRPENGIPTAVARPSVARPVNPATAVSTASKPLAFGPVAERTLRYPRSGDGEDALRLADGALFTLPTGFFQWSAAACSQWLTNGGSRVFPATVHFRWGLGGAGVHFVTVPPERWNGIGAAQLQEALARKDPELKLYPTQGAMVYLLETNIGLPATLAFQATDGSTGLLQVVQINGGDPANPEAPLFMRIRYKLLGGDPLRFGPLIERIVSQRDADAQGLVFLDLDTGRSSRPPFPLLLRSNQAPAFVELTPQLTDWIRKTDVDVLLQLGTNSWNMMTLEMQEDFVAQPTEWNQVAPKAVMDLFAQKDAQRLVRDMVPASSFGLDYRDEPSSCQAVRDRHNIVGLCRWTGLNTTPRSVKLRYQRVLAPL